MCLAQGPQRSDAGEARTGGSLVSSQALYHWATVLPRPIQLMSESLINTGMRKFRIDQDFLIEHWHMIYIMPVVFAEIYFWMKFNSILDIN